MSYDESSGSDSDTVIAEDMEAVRKAFSLTGVDFDVDYGATYESEDEDIELLRSIQQRFSVPTCNAGTEHGRISMKPLQTIIPSGLSDQNDDYCDDFETLRAIQRRFSQYDEADSMNICMEKSAQRSEQVGATNNIDLGKETLPNFFVKRNNNGRDCVDGRATNQNLNASSELAPVTDGSFPSSAQAFVEAIKKNRTCQKLIRDKLAQIGASMEENKKLRERVKILKDFQTTCRKRTGRALSQKKDARIQLISIPKQRVNASKVKDKNNHAIYQGPTENSHVALYRNEVSKYPISLSKEPWSKEEKEKLLKGIRQQIQEMLMRNLLSGGNEDSRYRVNMIKKIKHHKLTSEELKSFVEFDKVNWERVASIYVTGRSAPECESRWRNCEDPSINHGSWNLVEDKKLLHIVSNRGISNWIEIAMELKTNRTPFQCLSRFQKSLNASIIKNEWTPPDDEELRKAVAEYGETNWQLVASTLEGRTGTQCSNRWKKSLNPLRKRVGKWDPDEDKRLKIAVKLFGAKNWNKIAKFVPGRTQVQCRERWVNCLDPCLNMNEWTEDEDLILIKAIEEHNYCWSRIAASIPPRTDSQCLRRWRVLRPHHVHRLQVARKLKRAALISNFVDREGERPDITVQDFVTPLLIESDPKPNEALERSIKKKKRIVPRRARKVTHTEEQVFESNGHVGDTEATGNWKSNERGVPKIRSRRARQVTHTEKVLRLIDEDDSDKSRLFETERKATVKQKRNQREEKSMINGGFDDERRSIEMGGGAEFKVYFRRRYRKHDYPNLKRCSIFNRKSYGKEELGDEETLGSFFIKLKKRRMLNE